MDAIITNELTKRFQTVSALQGVNLRVPEGVAFACVGGPSSGKTTLIRILAGLCRPTSGDSFVLGISTFFESEKLHGVAGAVLNSARMYDHMTLSENLRFFAGLNGVDENDAIDRLSQLLHRLDIWEHRDQTVDRLTTGVRVRAALARALMNRPRVLLIDEPDGGLDRETADHMRELLSYWVTQEGMTVLLCTRNMAYAQLLGSQFAVIHQGVLRASGDMEALRERAGVRCRALLRLGEGQQPPKGFVRCDAGWQKDLDSEEELPRIVSRAVFDGKEIYEARIIPPTLEELYTALLEGGAERIGELDGFQEDSEDGYKDTETAPEDGSEDPEEGSQETGLF